MASKDTCNDAALGPAVNSAACRGGFDFTVAFEEVVMGIVPSAVFMLAAGVQVARLLRRKSLKVRPSWLFAAKLATISAFCGVQVAMVVQSALKSAHPTALSIVSSVLGLCAALSLAVLSVVEHRNTARPSFVISIYIILSLLFDIVRTRTTWLLGGHALAGTSTLALALKVAIIVLETVNKRSILLEAYAKLSSEATSSLPSRGLFLWLGSLLRAGSNKVLTMKDLLPIHEKLDTRTLHIQLEAAWAKGNKKGKHSLAVATLRAWTAEFAKIAVPRLLIVALNVLQPFIVTAVVENTLKEDSEEVRNEGYGLIGAVGLAYLGTAVFTGLYEHLAFRTMAMTRGGLIGMVYSKLTRSPTGSAETGDSAVITLIETDVETIGETWYLLTSDAWACVLQLGLAIWLLYRQVGVICIAPVIMAICFMLATVRLGKVLLKRQKIWFEAMQRRINFTTNTLSHLKSVKMLGLGEKMQQVIRGLRAAEIEKSRLYRSVSSLHICLLNLPDSYGALVTFAAFAIVASIQGRDTFTLSRAIASLSILSILMQPLQSLMFCVPQIYGALGCFERIQTYLNSDSWVDSRLSEIKKQQALPSTDAESAPSTTIVVRNATFGWSSMVPTIHDIDLCLTTDDNVTMVVGPVGCGKSTLLKSLLGETELHKGSVELAAHDVSYCDQNPWLSTGTIQSIIVGTSEYCERLYKAVLYACALDVDFALLENGDQTLIKSKGTTLSGGQKQRVSVARALFSRKKIAVFDDVLSGLDPVTRETVLTRVFGPTGLIRELGITAVLATHATSRLDVADKIIVMDAHGRIAKQGPPEAVPEAAITPAESTDMTIADSPKTAEDDDSDTESKTERQVGDFSVYKFYFRSLGVVNFCTFALIVCVETGAGTAHSAWISLWSSSPTRNNTGYWLGMYTMLAVIHGVCLAGATYFIYVVTVPRSARHLHGQVLTTAFAAPMSFIAPLPTGTLVNRFSQDMRLVDKVLPGNLVATCFILVGVIGLMALTVVASPYMAAAVPLIAGSLYFLQRFYLKTSRQLRLLELESKAPLLSHVIDTVHGVASIRAFGWEDSYTERMERLLSNCQKPFYLLLCIQRWLGVVLGLIVAALAVVLTALAVTLRGAGGAKAGFVGVALVNMMSLSQTMAMLVVMWTNLETSLGAIARIKTFTEDTPKEPEPEGPVDAEWPKQGAVKFDNWTAGYTDATILHGISMEVQPGQKVALCGRTGSGKSSLLTSMLGMVDGTAGRIIIDSVDLATISGETARKAVTCVTQDPFLFSGSVRLNLDPTTRKTDADIEAALQRVGLWPTLSRTLENNDEAVESPLDLAADELHLSHGQSQLFCLARAMLRESKVVLLDEPTSSVDAETETKIQDIVDGEFGAATVIMVTHRLSGIRRFDRVAVLQAGVLDEFGTPEELLADSSSALSRLYEAQHGGESERSE